GARPLLSAMAQAIAVAIDLEPGAAPASARSAIDAAVRRIAPVAQAGALGADLRALVGLGVGAPRTERGMAHAARLGVEERAQSGPVVVGLDDLQWADRALVDLLVDAHRHPWPAPVLLLGLSRTGVRGLPEVALPVLDADSMHALAGELLGGVAGSAEVA